MRAGLKVFKGHAIRVAGISKMFLEKKNHPRHEDGGKLIHPLSPGDFFFFFLIFRKKITLAKVMKKSTPVKRRKKESIMKKKYNNVLHFDRLKRYKYDKWKYLSFNAILIKFIVLIVFIYINTRCYVLTKFWFFNTTQNDLRL